MHPRVSVLPAVLALLVGTGVHAVDQLLFRRAGPIPILLTAPVVATLVYLYVRDATHQRLLALVAWGVVGSGVAVLGVYVSVVNFYLPRALTELEMVVYDLGMFLWFVLVLAGVYALAARSRRPRGVYVVLFGPLVQAAFGLLTRVLVAAGLYA